MSTLLKEGVNANWTSLLFFSWISLGQKLKFANFSRATRDNTLIKVNPIAISSCDIIHDMNESDSFEGCENENEESTYGFLASRKNPIGSSTENLFPNELSTRSLCHHHWYFQKRLNMCGGMYVLDHSSQSPGEKAIIWQRGDNINMLCIYILLKINCYQR